MPSRRPSSQASTEPAPTSRGRQAPPSSGPGSLPVRLGTSWSAARSTWSARSSPSGTSAQEPHAQVHAARDHRQQESKSEAGPQASTTYREAAEQDQGERYSSGAEKDVPRRARTRDFTASLAGGRSLPGHVGGGGLRCSPPYGQPVDQEADAGESAKQRDDLGDQAFSRVGHASRGAKGEDDERGTGDERDSAHSVRGREQVVAEPPHAPEPAVVVVCLAPEVIGDLGVGEDQEALVGDPLDHGVSDRLGLECARGEKVDAENAALLGEHVGLHSLGAKA